jgi:hypothetical protein
MQSRDYLIMNDSPDNAAERFEGVAIGCFLLLWDMKIYMDVSLDVLQD